MRCKARYKEIGSLLIPLVLTGMFLTGCATTKGPVAFSTEAANRIETMDLCIGLSQQEIYAEIDKSQISTFTGGGLLPALIDAAVDNHRLKKAESLIVPVRQELAGHDFPEAFEKSISRRLDTASWMKLDKVTVTNEVSKQRFEEELSASGAQSVLFVTCKYYFDSDFNCVNISADTELLPTSIVTKSKDSRDKALYRSTVVFRKPADAKLSKEEAVRYWAGNNGARIREVLDEGVEVVTNRIASEMRIDEMPAGKASIGKVQ